VRALHWAAAYARLILVLGLLAGLTLQGLAAALKPWIPQMVAVLLFLTAFRIGARAAFGNLGNLRRTAWLVLILQVAIPLTALALLHVLGWAETLAGMAVMFALSAPSISGAANFTIIAGRDPAPALRLLVLGTALFPLTVLPILWLLPGLDETQALSAVLGLVAVILGAAGAGFAARLLILPDPDVRQTRALDGLAAIVLAVIVIGLMSALGPALRETPRAVGFWLALVFAVNFGMQGITLAVLRWQGRDDEAVPISIVAGNRNVALFLVALPAGITDPLPLPPASMSKLMTLNMLFEALATAA
jgi:ACR3 family arsenite transporter